VNLLIPKFMRLSRAIALNGQPLYTVKLSFNASDEKAKKLLSTAWLFKIACHRVLNKSKELRDILIPSKIAWIKIFKNYAYDIIPNKRYSYGVVYLVYGIWESAKRLGIDYDDVELSDWLLFQHYEREVNGNVIRVYEDGSALVTVYSYDGSKDRILIKAKPNKGQKELLEKIIETKEKYMPKLVVRDYGIRDDKLYVRGEIHISVSYNFYLEYTRKYDEPKGDLIGGVDVNTDRINLAIVDEDGKLKDKKSFWFREVTARGFPRRKAWSIIGMKVHKLLKYAYHHGVSTIVLENPEIIGRLRLAWIRGGKRLHRNYNWRVSIFRNRIIEMITVKAPIYGLHISYVSPRGTTHSKEHDDIIKRYGLDRHVASAYLIALKSI
jgi:hypothetical protein